MMLRWQILLRVPAVCALLGGGFSANLAQGQCCCRHGGTSDGLSGGLPNSRILQSLMQQQLLQQQQLQQMQLVQQVQRQQQLLLTARIKQQMRDLAQEGPDAIKTALKDPKPEIRLIAALTVGKYGPALPRELIELLTDDNPSVRDAARRSLVSLSSKRDGKPTGRPGVDFGPAPGSNEVAQRIAIRKWRDWFGLQDRKLAALDGFALPPGVAAPPKRIIPVATAPIEKDIARPGEQKSPTPSER